MGFLCITIDSSFCDAQILVVVVDERLAIIPLVVPYAGLAVMSLVVQCVLKLLLSFTFNEGSGEELTIMCFPVLTEIHKLSRATFLKE